MICLGASLGGIVLWTHFKTASKEETFSIQRRLQTFYPLKEQRHFVILILGKNQENFSERQLQSIFDQSYQKYHITFIDDGSKDLISEKVRSFCVDKKKEEKLTLIHADSLKEEMGLLYETIHQLDPNDIVIYLTGGDWFLHENVLEHLNCAYANPEVKLTYSRTVKHPDYEKISGKVYSDAFLKEKKWRILETLPHDTFVTFPAFYFQKIRLQDFLFEGRFVDEQAFFAFLYPLFEMGAEGLLFIDELMLVKDCTRLKKRKNKTYLHKLMAVESYLRSLPSYPTVTKQEEKMSTSSFFHRNKADILIFSKDSPLHLYACLESLYQKVRDVNEVYVLYDNQGSEFNRAYLNLEAEFPKVHFFQVCDYPGSDFGSLLETTLTNRRYGASYLLMTDDHHLFDRKVSIHDCIAALEKSGGTHFFLSLNESEIDPSFPSIIPVEKGIYGWQLGEEKKRLSFFMSLCSKVFLQKNFNIKLLEDLDSFEKIWQQGLLIGSVPLFFEEPKALSLKLDGGESLSKKKAWGQKFIEGYKIDLPSLSCELDEIGEEGNYPLIKRETFLSSPY